MAQNSIGLIRLTALMEIARYENLILGKIFWHIADAMCHHRSQKLRKLVFHFSPLLKWLVNGFLVSIFHVN